MAVSSRTDLKTRKFYAAVLAEFVGTLLLVLVACGSTLQAQGSDVNSSTVRISLGFAFSIGSIVWAIGNVSGGNLNPGVTIAFFLTRRMSLVGFVLYIIAQTLGAITGAAILYALQPSGYNGNLGTPGLQDVSVIQGFFIEMLLTFVLVLVVFASCDERRGDVGGSVPLQIGVAIGMCHLWGVPLTGAGMNPARSLGPAVISNSLVEDHWVYWIGPLLGGALAGFLYEFVFAVNATAAKFKGFFTRNYDDKEYDSTGKRPQSNELPMKG